MRGQRVSCSLGLNLLYDQSHIMASAEDQESKGKLNDQLKEYIHQWRDERSKEEEELKRLKEKRAEEEKVRKEESEKRDAEALEKKKELEDAERKRQEMMAAQKEKGGKKSAAPAMDARKEMSKSKEQVEEEMKISLSIRIKPLSLDEMDSDELKNKANIIWNTIVVLETDKYDYEQRQLDQDYEFKELAERQKLQLRNKAIKKGLDPESFTGAHPPTIHMFSKYERRTDTRTYGDRKKLYEEELKLSGQKCLKQHGKRSSMNGQSDQKPGFQNGLEFVQEKRKETQKHQRVRKMLLRKPQRKKKIMMKRKKRRRRKKIMMKRKKIMMK